MNCSECFVALNLGTAIRLGSRHCQRQTSRSSVCDGQRPEYFFSCSGFSGRSASILACSVDRTASNAARIQYGGIQHAGILVSNLSRSLHFYLNVLKMADDTHLRNAKLPFPGAFVRAGGTQIHLMVGNVGGVPPPSFQSGRPEHGGRDYHVAITVRSVGSVQQNLESYEIPFTMSKSGRRALFCRDPDGNALEFIETPSLGDIA